MAKQKKSEVPAEAVEVKNEQEVIETTAENNESENTENIIEELVSESVDEDKVETESVTSEGDVLEETEENHQDEESVDILDGTEGDAGQTNLNDIPVDFEDISVSKNEDEYVNAHIKLENVLVDLKDIRDKDISFSKNEDLEVTIVYVEHAIDSILKLRK